MKDSDIMAIGGHSIPGKEVQELRCGPEKLLLGQDGPQVATLAE